MDSTILIDQSLVHHYPVLRLPDNPRLKISALAALFSDRSTSYKYLFFLALLDITAESPLQGTIFSQPIRISLRTLLVNMLQFGWYPHCFFHLSYGKSDRVGQALDKLDFMIDENSVTHLNTKVELISAIECQFDKINAQHFGRFVPYRLLSPFFREELAGLPDQHKNRKIIELSRQRAQSASPAIYHFNDGGTELIVHPEWARYFIDNYAILRGWALLHWARYLQHNNPNAPSILDKIEPPQMRGSLQLQRHYWREVLKRVPLHCIYSQTPLDERNFSLDHFLPWSFICHDELWNLIPAEPRANTAKGRRLPNERLIKELALQQYEGLKIYNDIHYGNKIWQSVANIFIEGLALDEEQLLDKQALIFAYNNKLRPLMALAKNMGY